MKRHRALQDLSREHHGALRLARDAGRAATSASTMKIDELARRVVAVFPVEIDPHFCVEEQGILVLLARAGETGLAGRAVAEHEELRHLATALLHPQASTLGRFAELLAAHVRFEERELFGVVQKLMDN